MKVVSLSGIGSIDFSQLYKNKVDFSSALAMVENAQAKGNSNSSDCSTIDGPLSLAANLTYAEDYDYSYPGGRIVELFVHFKYLSKYLWSLLKR